MLPADDSSMLVLLLETHQQLWSQLQADAGAGKTAHLTLSGFLQQARPPLHIAREAV